MKKRTRTTLFIICVVLFCLVAPSMILYSQGYRVDFEKKRIVQTGGLYLKVLPADAEVYINGKFKDGTTFFTNSLFIENLLPKTYQIEVKKDGYHPWQKTLAVREKEVTDAKNIVLITQSPDFTILTTSPEEISLIVAEIAASATSSDKQKVIEVSDYEIWIVFPEKQTGQSLEEQPDKLFLTRFSKKISQVYWLNDYYLIFNLGNKIKVAEIDSRDRLNMVDLAEFESPEIFWSRADEKLYVLSEGKLYLSTNLLP